MKPESRLRAQIVKALRARGHLVVVQHGSVFSQAGVADLLVCRHPDGKFLALEIKTKIGDVTPLQAHFLDQVQAAGGKPFLVRSVEGALMAIDLDLDDLDLDLDDLVLDSEQEDDEATPAPAAPTKGRGRPRKTAQTPAAAPRAPSPRTPRQHPAPASAPSSEAITLADDENDVADEPLLTRYEQLVQGLSVKMDAVLERLDEAIELMTSQGAEM